MIQANELRIGSKVLFAPQGRRQHTIKPRICTVKILNETVCVVDDKGLPLSLDYKTKDIQPIPLTPEILEKCGFVLTDDGISPYWRLELMRTEVISIEDDWSVGLNAANEGSSIGYATGPGRCQFLHQLQNLYFALTGNEINSKP